MSDPSGQSSHPNPGMIRFRCPGCRSELQMPVQYAGRQVRCSQCKMELQVPVSKPSIAEGKIICICGSCKAVFQVLDHISQTHCPKCAGRFELPQKEGLVSASNMFRFRCRACGQVYCVLSKYGGKKIKCLHCQKPLPIPIPAKPKDDAIRLIEPELDVVEEVSEQKPQDWQSSYNLNEMQEGPALGVEPPGQSSIRRSREEKKTSLVVRLKVPLIAVAGVVGFVIGFLAVSHFVSSDSSSEIDRPVIQSPQAIAFAERIIRQLAQKNIEQASEYFGEEADELALSTLARMLDRGALERIESTVIYSNIESGAEGYRVHSKVLYDDGTEQGVEMGFGFFEQWDDWEEEAVSGTIIMSIQLSRADGSVLYTAGMEDLESLTAELDLFVSEYAIPEISTAWLCTILIGIFVLGIVTLIAQITVFTNAGEPGWAVFIPVYREVCMARIADKSEGLGWLCGLSSFIPYIGSVIYVSLICMFSVGISRTYGRGVVFGLGLCFLPFIFYPILAFGSNP